MGNYRSTILSLSLGWYYNIRYHKMDQIQGHSLKQEMLLMLWLPSLNVLFLSSYILYCIILIIE